MPDDIVGGPGWVISATDLKPVITDAEAFAMALAEDTLRQPITHLWNGDAAGALRLLEHFPSTLRVRGLRADCHRDLGDFERAVAAYDDLVSETTGTPHEATMRQHRGKVHFAAGDIERAIFDFECAAALREADDHILLASANQALEAARERRDSAHP